MEEFCALDSKEIDSKDTEADSTQVSPLWMITQEPVINELVNYLQDYKNIILNQPDSDHCLSFEKSRIAEVRAAFSRVIREGERYLHLLCHLYAEELYGAYNLQSVVLGLIPRNSERITLVQDIKTSDLLELTDLDQGNKQLQQIRIHDGSDWIMPSLVANVIEYNPLQINVFNMHKTVSRIKAEEEIWNKVVDEIFNLDSLVLRDKELRKYSRFVKDIFGIKFIVSSLEDVNVLHEKLSAMRFSAEALAKFGFLNIADADRLKTIEVKNYLNDNYQKQTGWEAIKTVVSWCGKTFEIQIQPLSNFLYEREGLTKESHRSFKMTRESVRNSLAKRIPLFSFYRDLLKWLFIGGATKAPVFNKVKIDLL
jgi:hypothetical protein